jgi:general L-amino acid transport system permease protein
MVLPEISRFKFSSGMTMRPELFSVVVALSTYTSTYISEIVRSSILAVPKGQLEAAKSLGFAPYRRLQLIIVPQSLQTMIPPVTNQYLNIIKNTSLGMAVAYPDLTSVFAGTTLNQTGRALEVMSLVMITYLSISLLTSVLINWYNSSIIERKGEILKKEDIPFE